MIVWQHLADPVEILNTTSAADVLPSLHAGVDKV